MKPGMFRANARIVQACTDRVAFEDLTIAILQQVGAVAVQYAGASACQAGAMFHLVIDAMPTSFDSDDANCLVIKEWIEQPHCVGAAPDCSDHAVRQAALSLVHLPADFLADDGLEIPNHRGVGVRTRNCSDAIERIADIRHPIA